MRKKISRQAPARVRQQPVAGKNQYPTVVRSEPDDGPPTAKQMKRDCDSDDCCIGLDLVKSKTDPHVVAGAKITQGTVILKEEPVLTLVDLSGFLVPNGEGHLVVERPCFGCGLPNANYKCKCCSLTMCSNACPKVQNHSEWECEYLVRISKDPILVESVKPPKVRIAPLDVLDTMMLRVHLLAEKNRPAYQGMLQLILHPRVVELKKTNQQFQQLSKVLDSWAWLSSSYCTFYNKRRYLLRDVLAITLLMPAHLQSSPTYLSFLYPTLTNWMTHSCVPNTDFAVSDVNNQLVLVAGKDIQQHERIEVNLWPIEFWATSQRKAFLKKLHIQCDCKRCQNPTEFNTFVGAIPCRNFMRRAYYCDGFYYPTSRDSELDWKCRKCSSTMPTEEAKEVTRAFFEWPAQRLRNLDDRIAFLNRPIFHATHPTILQVWKHITEQLAGSIFGCSKDVLVGRLRMRELYIPTKALLWFYFSVKLVFHRNTAYVLMLHTVSEFYLQRRLISMKKKRVKGWKADRAKALLYSANRLEVCKSVFAAYASIPKYAEYLAYVTEMQTFLRHLATQDKQRSRLSL